MQLLTIGNFMRVQVCEKLRRGFSVGEQRGTEEEGGGQANRQREGEGDGKTDREDTHELKKKKKNRENQRCRQEQQSCYIHITKFH